MYKSVWKCRLCGEKFLGERNFSTEEVAAMMLNKTGWSDTSYHGCFGGDTGMADFQGFRKMDSEIGDV